MGRAQGHRRLTRELVPPRRLVGEESGTRPQEPVDWTGVSWRADDPSFGRERRTGARVPRTGRHLCRPEGVRGPHGVFLGVGCGVAGGGHSSDLKRPQPPSTEEVRPFKVFGGVS